MKAIHSTRVIRTQALVVGEILPRTTLGKRMRASLHIAATRERTREANARGAQLTAYVKPPTGPTAPTAIVVLGPAARRAQRLDLPSAFTPFLPSETIA